MCGILATSTEMLSFRSWSQRTELSLRLFSGWLYFGGSFVQSAGLSIAGIS
jgi:hypothetical protein